jgi:hypothetical protein
MNPKTCIRIATASFLIAAAVTARAAAGDPPPSSLDLGAVKPKADTTSTANPGSLIPVSPSQLLKQKSSTDAGATGNASNTAVGTAITSPLGAKGVLGGPLTGSKSAQPTQDETAASNDVVVKLPSNMKK